MYIKRIVVRNFRNILSIDIPVSKGVTCVIGENNVGKSNFLNALRLVLDPGFSSQNRSLSATDFSMGVNPSNPCEIFISIEFGDFKGTKDERATLYLCEVDDLTARLSYRFRPRAEIRTAIESGEHPGVGLVIDDYHWELVGGGDSDPTDVTWKDDYGRSVRFDLINQNFIVVFMEALRDVETKLKQSRFSPLVKLIEAGAISETDKNELVNVLTNANDKISVSPSVAALAKEIHQSLYNAAGDTFSFDTQLGMSAADFSAIARALELILSTENHKNYSISQNGLGLNNVLYVSMLISYFKRRISTGQSAGNLLLIEEPEAHLHPQLQRVLFESLKVLGFQVITTTHSTHISSQCGIDNQVIMSNVNEAWSHVISGAKLPINTQGKLDIERYLDATRSVLLYARRVLLVEGPAEVFLLPPLIKKALGIDLDRHGISIVAIHGVHFEEYAGLFGENAIRKRCAIVADGDAVPSDGSADVMDNDLPDHEIRTYSGVENAFVKSFVCNTTLERELALPGNLDLFSEVSEELGAPKIAKKLRAWKKQIDTEEDPEKKYEILIEAGGKILNTAKRFGKARFAQIASRKISDSAELPEYISAAVKWLVEK